MRRGSNQSHPRSAPLKAPRIDILRKLANPLGQRGGASSPHSVFSCAAALLASPRPCLPAIRASVLAVTAVTTWRTCPVGIGLLLVAPPSQLEFRVGTIVPDLSILLVGGALSLQLLRLQLELATGEPTLAPAHLLADLDSAQVEQAVLLDVIEDAGHFPDDPGRP